MKKYLTLLFVALFAISCEGPAGPQGPPGPPGPVVAAGQIFEVVADFTSENQYQGIFAFPQDIVVLDTDIVMVYWLWTDDPVDVWQPLPATIYFNDGEIQYAFDHTSADVRIFLDGNIDLSTLGSQWTDNQVFRVAIIPAEEANKVNLKDMKAVMNLVNKAEVKRYNIKELQ